MSERQRGRDPDRPSSKPSDNHEQHGGMPQYYEARRFPDDPTSNTAYEGVRDVLKETPCDLSTYRTILLPDQSWHVLVLGGAPVEALRQRIEASLVGGVAVELPEDIWQAFNVRRLEQMAQGKPWVERRAPRKRRLW
jgi:hypothetical protein